MTSEKRKEILDFWTLCEIADFERFKKDTFHSFDLNNKNSNKALQSEYEEISYAFNKTIKKEHIDNKTINLQKVYVGIIRSDEAIKYIYNKLKERNLLPNDYLSKSDEDIERLPFGTDFTYMTYIYLDEDGYMISLSGKSIVINPLFYILKNLLEKSLVNTNAYNKFADKVSEDFAIKYQINQKSEAFIVPDLDYLLEHGRILTNLKKSTIGILDKLAKDVENLAQNANDDRQEKAKATLSLLEKERDSEKSNFEFAPHDIQSNFDNIYLATAIKIAEKYYYKNIYLLTINKLNDKMEIPKNLFLVGYIDNKKILHPSLIYSNKNSTGNGKITQEKFRDIFEDYSRMLYLDSTNLFYTENQQNLSIFAYEYSGKRFSEINEIEKDKLLSYYINALDEVPSKLSIPYMDGLETKEDINGDTTIRQKYNDIEYFKQINARWVSKYHLNFAQQTAVNQFLSKLNKGKDNIFSINGPPGTGKTTLLKDVVAEIVTRRVEHCIRLDGDLFDGNGLKSELSGLYEIVVASNNNAAVENITLELPKIENFHLDYIDYKKDDFLLGEFATDFYGFESWNLISINLGNSKNINNFRDNFSEFQQRVRYSGILEDNAKLNKLKSKYITEISKCRKRIRHKENTFLALGKISKYHSCLKQLTNKKEILESEIEELKTNIENAKKTEADYLSKSRKNEESIKLCREIIALKEDEKKMYNIFTKIIKFRKYTEVKNSLSSEKRKLSGELIEKREVETLQEANRQILSENKKLLKIKENEYETLSKNLNKVKSFYEVLLNEKSKNYNINNDDFYNKEESELQKSSIYNEESYLRDKSLLFALSMQLSEIYFLLNFRKFCSSIDDFFEAFRKPMPKKDQIILQQNFSALSFILPVISTTLAASYLMFQNIKSFGTLLCDESGQATPQSVIGLLNRTNNALIVGDPLQVEPVFTAPIILIRLIQIMYKIEDNYSPFSSSVQILADEANSLGSYYEVDGQRQWVGMPLVVHRRCVDPMFTISNKISYNEKMVLATPPIKDSDPINSLPSSGWIDIKSEETDFNGNVSEKEIEALRLFIEKHRIHLQNNYYIISPFRGIYKYRNEFDKEIIGTVHTFQGKEQDVVFFVLGGNVKREGAKRWVSSKANILNVATTRAKKRIYFIGDYELWRKYRYFKDVVGQVKVGKFEVA